MLSPSKRTGLAGYKPLLCVQESPVQNNWSVNYCLRENQCTAGRWLKGAFSETPRGNSLGKSIMLLFLGHQHPIRRKPSDAKAGCSSLGKGISAHTHSVSLTVFKTNSKRPPCPVLTALCLALNWIEGDDLPSLRQITASLYQGCSLSVRGALRELPEQQSYSS